MNGRRQSGATLVELAVSAAIGAVVVTAALQIHATAAGTYAAVTALERLEERGRTASTLLRREIARAARAPCGGGAPVDDRADGSVTRSRHLLPHHGLQGDGHGLTVDSTAADPARAPWRVTATEGEEHLVGLHIEPLNRDSAPAAEYGDRLLTGHCGQGLYRLRVTGGSGGWYLTVADGPSPVPPLAGAPVWSEPTLAGAIRTVEYRWRPDQAQDGEPALYRNNQPAVAGVEAVVLRYGVVEGAADGGAVRFVPAELVADWERVTAVRAHLLIRSPLFAALPVSGRTHSLGGETAGPFDDRRLRRTWTVTAPLRGRVP